ncbi:nurim homolog [Condylostylus longicornis]|uniref:nurim homolog n=1 Tax=Condylostylus longicornis TaxID=2530218 RepID=UPI00244E5072|nr:nurim homolog [Condylostylus longicornis]
MVKIKQSVCLILSSLVFVYTFYVVGKLMLFLSNPGATSIKYTWILNILDNQSRLETAFVALVFDALYVILFILQHSLMKSNLIIAIFEKTGLGLIERSVYCLTSSLCLYYLIENWLSAPTIVLWQINVADNPSLWWMFVLVHVFAWIVIYGGSLIMDLPEIMGLKHVYYDIKDYAPPMAYKSFELRHLYGHIRHPSFIGFLIVLWFTNLMTVDRLLLSIMLSLYMYVAWSTDHNDVIYQKCQLQRKREELKSH